MSSNQNELSREEVLFRGIKWMPGVLSILSGGVCMGVSAVLNAANGGNFPLDGSVNGVLNIIGIILVAAGVVYSLGLGTTTTQHKINHRDVDQSELSV